MGLAFLKENAKPFIFNFKNAVWGWTQVWVRSDEINHDINASGQNLVERSNFNSAVFAAVILHVIFLTLEFGMPQDQESMTKEIAVSIRQTDEKLSMQIFWLKLISKVQANFVKHIVCRAICLHR